MWHLTGGAGLRTLAIVDNRLLAEAPRHVADPLPHAKLFPAAWGDPTRSGPGQGVFFVAARVRGGPRFALSRPPCAAAMRGRGLRRKEHWDRSIA